MEHFSWRRLGVLLVPFGAFKGLLSLDISLRDCYFLLRSDLIRRCLCLEITHDENFWLIRLNQLVLESFNIENSAVGGRGAFGLLTLALPLHALVALLACACVPL